MKYQSLHQATSTSLILSLTIVRLQGKFTLVSCQWHVLCLGYSGGTRAVAGKLFDIIVVSFNFRSRLFSPSCLAGKPVWWPEKSHGIVNIVVTVADVLCAKIMQLVKSILVFRRKHSLKSSHKGRKNVLLVLNSAQDLPER